MQEEEDWVSRNLDTLRAVPLAAGALGVVGVLTNRVASGVRRLYWVLGPCLRVQPPHALVQYRLASAAALPWLLCTPGTRHCTAVLRCAVGPTPPALAVRRSRPW